MPDKPDISRKLSRAEQITIMVHYYRAEVQRSLAWRERLDRTTNWAVAATAAILGFTFAHPEIPHAAFLFGLTIIYILLYVESRRYRFFDAYEYRVRLLHQNFISGALTKNLDLDENPFWLAELVSDLKYPQYKMDMTYAIGRRLKANYIYLFSILIVGWLLKIQLHPSPARSWPQFLDQASVGGIPGVAIMVLILLFAFHLAALVVIGRRPGGGRDVLHSSPKGSSGPLAKP